MRTSWIGLIALLALTACEKMPESAVTENTDAGIDGGNVAVATSGMIFCREINRRTTQADCDDLTDTAAQAKNGTAAFNVPDMVRDQPSPIELSISLTPPPTDDDHLANAADAMADAADNLSDAADNLRDAESNAVAPPAPAARPPASRHDEMARRTERPADDVAALPGRTEQYSPLVGRDMRAELIGEGFTIVAQSPASQVLSPGGTTTWNWQVTPQRSANYALTIKTSVEGVMANGAHVVLGSTTQTRAVRVRVRWYDTARDWLAGTPAWLGLIGGVVVALTLLIWRGRKLWDAIRGKGEPPKEGG